MNNKSKARTPISAEPEVLLGEQKAIGQISEDVLSPVMSSVHLQGKVGAWLKCCIDKRVMRQDIETLVTPFRERLEEDAGGFRCEFWGKWCTSAALAYTCEPTVENRNVLETAVKMLLETQDSDGYIGSYKESVQLEGWDIWGRKYVLLGLLAYYEVTGECFALNAAERSMDYLIRQVSEQKINLTEKGFSGWMGLPASSILEPVSLLYQYTGNAEYLAFANHIITWWNIPNALTERGLRLIEDALQGVPPIRIAVPKAYEMMSCYEGLCVHYRNTGDQSCLDAVLAVAHAIRNKEIMLTGSGSNQELWCDGVMYQTEMLEQPVETCVTATWMKLCYQLLRITGDSVWADELEISLYNALGSAMTPNGEWWSYYAPLTGERVPSHPQHDDVGLSCCVASGPRGLLLTPSWAIMRSAAGIVVNLYAPGEADIVLPAGENVRIELETTYPVIPNIRMRIRPSVPVVFALQLRIPSWSKHTTLIVNGESVSCVPGKYAKIHREWLDNDTVELTLDLTGYAIPAPGGAPHIALRRGPIVLALDNRVTPHENKTVHIIMNDDRTVDLVPLEELPEGVWMGFKAPFLCRPSHLFNHHQIELAFTDYASAGNQWSAENRFRVWLPQPLFLNDIYPENSWMVMYPESIQRPSIPERSKNEKSDLVSPNE